MASIIPNFEYDIFISYRHNDNRSVWVTDFVNALKNNCLRHLRCSLFFLSFI